VSAWTGAMLLMKTSQDYRWDAAATSSRDANSSVASRHPTGNSFARFTPPVR
jgi:hypothetical protein